MPSCGMEMASGTENFEIIEGCGGFFYVRANIKLLKRRWEIFLISAIFWLRSGFSGH
jgi:hypothetical protein